MTGGITYQIVIWYDGCRKHWRYKCNHPEDGAEHPTTCTDPDYHGCAQTAARNHADAAHADDQATIEVSENGILSNLAALRPRPMSQHHRLMQRAGHVGGTSTSRTWPRRERARQNQT